VREVAARDDQSMLEQEAREAQLEQDEQEAREAQQEQDEQEAREAQLEQEVREAQLEQEAREAQLEQEAREAQLEQDAREAQLEQDAREAQLEQARVKGGEAMPEQEAVEPAIQSQEGAAAVLDAPKAPSSTISEQQLTEMVRAAQAMARGDMIGPSDSVSQIDHFGRLTSDALPLADAGSSKTRVLAWCPDPDSGGAGPDLL